MLYVLVPAAALAILGLVAWYRPSGLPERQHEKRRQRPAEEVRQVAYPTRPVFDWRRDVPARDLDPRVDFWLQELSRTRRDRWT